MGGNTTKSHKSSHSTLNFPFNLYLNYLGSAIRNPIIWTWEVGAPESRSDTRQPLPSVIQLPPRTTRPSPEVGPVGFV